MNTTKKITDLLGSDASWLLEHECKLIPKKSVGLVFLFMFAVALQSCVISSQIVEVNTDGQKILLLSSNSTISKNYEEVVHIELTGSVFTSRQKLKSKLIKKAVENKCDAIIDTKFKTNFIWPHVTGIGIRFKE